MSSSVGSMTVVTSGTLPNVLPHYKIRENPNISQSEWLWLNSLHKKPEVHVDSFIYIYLYLFICLFIYLYLFVYLFILGCIHY